MKCYAVPLLNILIGIRYKRHLFGRIINQCCKLITFAAGECISEKLVELFLHLPGTGIEYMKECFVFTVDIRNKVFRSLGQIEDSLKINNLRACRFDCWILLCQKLEIMKLRGRENSFCVHNDLLIAAAAALFTYRLGTEPPREDY